MNTTMLDHAKRVLAEQERQAANLTDDGQDQAPEAPAERMAVSDTALDYAMDLEDATRLDQAVAMRHFFPGADSQAYAFKHLTTEPIGTRILVGSLIGIVRKAEDGTSELGPYIRLEGEFYQESRLTGAKRYHSDGFLPNGYAKQIKAALAHSDQITFDVAVAIEHTGRKGTPWGYVILSRLALQPSNQLAEMIANRNRRLEHRQPSLLTANPAA